MLLVIFECSRRGLIYILHVYSWKKDAGYAGDAMAVTGLSAVALITELAETLTCLGIKKRTCMAGLYSFMIFVRRRQHVHAQERNGVRGRGWQPLVSQQRLKTGSC